MSDVRGALIERLRSATLINDPVAGSVSPQALETDSPLWPGDRWQDILAVARTAAEGRELEEYAFVPVDGGKPLPVAIMFENGDARIYSAHGLVAERKPFLPIDPSITPSLEAGDFLDGYFEHLAKADVEGSIAMFEPDGYIQHSNGDRYQGAERLREDYVNMVAANSGKIELTFSTVTDDGAIRAFECVMPNGRPAVAVYERGASGKIAAIRISL